MRVWGCDSVLSYHKIESLHSRWWVIQSCYKKPRKLLETSIWVRGTKCWLMNGKLKKRNKSFVFLSPSPSRFTSQSRTDQESEVGIRTSIRIRRSWKELQRNKLKLKKKWNNSNNVNNTKKICPSSMSSPSMQSIKKCTRRVSLRRKTRIVWRMKWRNWRQRINLSKILNSTPPFSFPFPSPFSFEAVYWRGDEWE